MKTVKYVQLFQRFFVLACRVGTSHFYLLASSLATITRAHELLAPKQEIGLVETKTTLSKLNPGWVYASLM